MKLWLTSQEIADLRLPGLPTTKRNVNSLIARENWQDHASLVRERAAAGGGFEYHIDLLPRAARLAYLRHTIEVDVDERLETPDDDTLSTVARIECDARAVILRTADSFRTRNDLSLAASDRLFAELYAAGDIPVSDWVRETVRSFAARSLSRWRSELKQGVSLGVDRGASRRGTGVLDRAEDGAVRNYILALIANNSHFTAKHIRKAVKKKFGETLDVISAATGEINTVELPPLRTFQNTIKGWKHSYRNELLQLTDPDGWKNKVRFVATGTTRADRLNELWEMDASPADVMCKDGRHSIYLTVDIFPRRTKVLISKTPRASAVGLLTRKCLTAWGVPETIKTDCGSDFVAIQTRTLFDALRIRHHQCDPGRPEQKGTVERHIRTYQHDLAVTLPGFIGHSVADRKVIEGRKAFLQRLGAGEVELLHVDMTAAELQEWSDHWTDVVYAHNPHEGLNRRTPFQVANDYDGPVRRIENKAALDILLAPVAGKDGIRRVTKSGIRIDGNFYLSGSLSVGEDVFCRMDPSDLGRIHVFTPDGETFLDHAVCWQLAGLDPAATIAAVRAKRKALTDERIKDIRREKRRIGPRDVANAVREDADKRSASLIDFPRPTTPHTTPEIAAALSAATGEHHEAPVDPPLDMSGEPASVVPFTPKAADGNGRPAFRTDQEMAAWLANNPEQMTDRDRKHLADRLRSWTFRQMLPAVGVDADALTALVKTKRTQAGTGQ